VEEFGAGSNTGADGRQRMLHALGAFAVVPVVLFILVAVILVGVFVFKVVLQAREDRAIRRANLPRHQRERQ